MLQLDPQSIADRVRASGQPAHIPSLKESILRGVIGFTLVSVAGFAPWALFGSFFRKFGEVGMYVACAVVFIGLSGPALHRLIIGPGSLWRFYVLFSTAFIVYSAAWIGLYISLRKAIGGEAGVHIGGAVGLLVGTAAMGTIFAWAFGNLRAAPAAIASLFILNAAGYFAGWPIEHGVPPEYLTLAKTVWGVTYGVGFGAGIGMAFFLCQRHTHGAILSDGNSQ